MADKRTLKLLLFDIGTVLGDRTKVIADVSLLSRVSDWEARFGPQRVKVMLRRSPEKRRPKPTSWKMRTSVKQSRIPDAESLILSSRGRVVIPKKIFEPVIVEPKKRKRKLSGEISSPISLPTSAKKILIEEHLNSAAINSAPSSLAVSVPVAKKTNLIPEPERDFDSVELQNVSIEDKPSQNEENVQLPLVNSFKAKTRTEVESKTGTGLVAMKTVKIVKISSMSLEKPKLNNFKAEARKDIQPVLKNVMVKKPLKYWATSKNLKKMKVNINFTAEARQDFKSETLKEVKKPVEILEESPAKDLEQAKPNNFRTEITKNFKNNTAIHLNRNSTEEVKVTRPMKFVTGTFAQHMETIKLNNLKEKAQPESIRNITKVFQKEDSKGKTVKDLKVNKQLQILKNSSVQHAEKLIVTHLKIESKKSLKTETVDQPTAKLPITTYKRSSANQLEKTNSNTTKTDSETETVKDLVKSIPVKILKRLSPQDSEKLKLNHYKTDARENLKTRTVCERIQSPEKLLKNSHHMQKNFKTESRKNCSTKAIEDEDDCILVEEIPGNIPNKSSQCLSKRRSNSLKPESPKGGKEKSVKDLMYIGNNPEEILETSPQQLLNQTKTNNFSSKTVTRVIIKSPEKPAKKLSAKHLDEQLEDVGMKKMKYEAPEYEFDYVQPNPPIVLGQKPLFDLVTGSFYLITLEGFPLRLMRYNGINFDLVGRNSYSHMKRKLSDPETQQAEGFNSTADFEDSNSVKSS